MALVVAGCSEVEIKRQDMSIAISNGIPIQFFLNGRVSRVWDVEFGTEYGPIISGQPRLPYNEQLAQEDLIDFYCFEQEFNCQDPQGIQFTDVDAKNEYELLFYDEEGILFDTLDFTRTREFNTETEMSFTNDDFAVSLTDWNQFGSGSDQSFNWDAPSGARANSSSGTLAQSKKMYQGRLTEGIGGYDKWPPGHYKFKVKLTNQSTLGSAPLTEGFFIYGSNDNVTNESSITEILARPTSGVEYELELTTTQEFDFLGFRFYKIGPSSGSKINVKINFIEIEENPIDYTRSVHSLSFLPDELDLCDKKVKFKIRIKAEEYSEITTYFPGDIVIYNDIYYIANMENLDDTPTTPDGRWSIYDPIEAETDYVQFSSLTPKSVLLQYKSLRNFDGIVYDEESDYFNLRIQGRFFHEGMPVNSKSIPLSRGRIINTSSEVKHGTKLEIQDVPYYMHTKILSALSHAVSGTLLINGIPWVLDPMEYDMGDERPDRYPMRPASIFLTQKNYVTRNVV